MCQPRSFENGYALIIAIDQYQNLPDLGPAVANDGLDVTALLCDSRHCGYPGTNVRLLQGAQATQQEIWEGLKWLALVASEDSTVFIYFSGHGGIVEHEGQTGSVLAPYEASPDSSKTFISTEELETALNGIGSSRLVVVLDCCHAPPARPVQPDRAAARRVFNAVLDKKALQALAGGRGRVVFYSCSQVQRSHSLEGCRNSLFTHFLLRGLRGKAAAIRFNPVLGMLTIALRGCACLEGLLSKTKRHGLRDLGTRLRSLRLKCENRGLGTIRVFQLFRFVRRAVRRAGKEGKVVQSPTLYTYLEDDFPLALLPAPHPIVPAATLLATALLITVLIWSPVPICAGPSLFLERLNDLDLSTGTVLVSAPAAAWARVDCLPQGGLPLAIETRPVGGLDEDWTRVGNRWADDDGAVQLDLALPQASRWPEIGEMRAILGSDTRMDGPHGREDCGGCPLESPIVQFRVGSLEWTHLDGVPIRAEQHPLTVTALISLRGRSLNLEGMELESWSRPLAGSGLPPQLRGTTKVARGEWSFSNLPVRNKYEQGRKNYEVWVNMIHRPDLSTKHMQVALPDLRNRIERVGGQRVTEGQPIRLDSMKPSISIEGRVVDFLPGERVQIALAVTRHGVVQSLPWHTARELTDGNWKTSFNPTGLATCVIYARVSASLLTGRTLDTADDHVEIVFNETQRIGGDR